MSVSKEAGLNATTYRQRADEAPLSATVCGIGVIVQSGMPAGC